MGSSGPLTSASQVSATTGVHHHASMIQSKSVAEEMIKDIWLWTFIIFFKVKDSQVTEPKGT